MKKAHKPDEVDEILPELDFSKGVRGKYYERVMRGTNLVKLDPDVQEMFPNSDAVNRALRAVGELVKTAKRKRTKSVA